MYRSRYILHSHTPLTDAALYNEPHQVISRLYFNPLDAKLISAKLL